MKMNLISLGMAAIWAQTAFAGLEESAQKFIDVNGVISMEAERYTSQTGYGKYANREASGGYVMRADGATGSRLNFQLDIRQAGTWYLWIRNHATGDLNNGLQLGLDGRTLAASSHPLAGAVDVYLPKVGWNWQPEWLRGGSHSGPVTVYLSAGRHTLSLIKRKIENPLIDKVVLTTSSQPPTGFGPASPVVTTTGDAYEPDNSALTAKAIGNGQTQSRTIHAAGNVDWVKFTIGGLGARNVRLETSGASGDTQMWLYKANGTLVAFNDNGGVGNFSLIAVASLAPGTYRVKIQEYGNNGTLPSYRLKASWATVYLTGDAYEPDNFSATAKVIGNGQTQSRTIHAAGNVDWAEFTIRGNGARNLRLETSGSSGDTQMWLYKANGSLVAFNDNGGVGNFSLITLSSLAPGTYRVKIQEHGNNGTLPAYRLKASWATVYLAGDAYEPDNSAAAAKAIRNGQTQSRAIHAVGDVDWVKLVIGAAGARNVQLTTDGAVGNTQMWLIRGGDGARLAYDDNSGNGFFSRIVAASLAPGTYYIKIQEYGNNARIPAYTLKASWSSP